MSDTNNWTVAVDLASGRRRFDASELPISLGASPTDDIGLANVNGSLQIGALDGVFFVQVLRGARNVRVAGQQVESSRRLEDGDEIAIDTARVRCHIDGGRLTLAVKAQTTAGDTAPPDLEQLAKASVSKPDEVAITPIAFNAESKTAESGGGFRPSKSTIAVVSAFVVLGVLAWFAFTARSVQFVSTPQVEVVELPDTLFKFRIGDRYMLRSGRHRVTAELDGYYPLDAVVAVGASPDQSIPLQFEKLPGLVTITTEPSQGVDVFLDGVGIGEAPFRDYEIKPGEHELEFRLARHFTETIKVDVQGARVRQAVSAALSPNWAPLSVATNPPGAEVLVDGELRGVSPLDVELVQGDYELELRLRGYNAWRDDIEIVASEPLVLPQVVLEQADGRVRLVSSPPEAAVSVNGQFAGRTPLDLRLRPGREHEIVVTKPGYETVSTELSVAADSGRTVSLELAAQYGQVNITTDPPGAEIWIDEELTGSAPAQLSLTALPHSIEVRLPGYASASADLTPRPGMEHTLPFELDKLDDLTGEGYPRAIHTSLDQELRIVPAGSFTMGTSRREAGRRSNEFLRPVELTEAFYLGATEVTNAQFRAYKADHDSGVFAGQSLNDDDQPVVNVSWDEIAQFLNWLSIRDSLQPVYAEGSNGWAATRPLRGGYRLPTEAEWAWAARFAGRAEPLTYPWGDEIPPPDRSGNYADIAASKILATSLRTYNDDFAVSAPVASFAANELGIFDLGGNVTEWVQDFYTLQYVDSDEVVVDPLGPESGEFHIVRGSSWQSATVTDLRVAYRNFSSGGRDDLGFRIARNLD